MKLLRGESEGSSQTRLCVFSVFRDQAHQRFAAGLLRLRQGLSNTALPPSGGSSPHVTSVAF